MEELKTTLTIIFLILIIPVIIFCYIEGYNHGVLDGWRDFSDSAVLHIKDSWKNAEDRQLIKFCHMNFNSPGCIK